MATRPEHISPPEIVSAQCVGSGNEFEKIIESKAIDLHMISTDRKSLFDLLINLNI